jgi:PAS domain S-box-containing protein
MKVAEALAALGHALSGEIDEQKIVDAVVKAGVELSGAQVGRFVPAGDGAASAASTCLPSELHAPVRSRSGEVLGAICFGHADPDVFSPRDEAMIAALASQAAIAIDNSRLVLALETQRAEAEEAGRHYRFLAESMPQLVWTADAEGRIDYVNERWTVYTGRPAPKMRGDVWRAVVHAEDRSETMRAWGAAVASGSPFEATLRLRRGDGTYRWHLVRAYSLCSETRRVIKWFGTCTDIHHQKRFEDSQRLLSESSRVLAASLDIESTLGTVASLVATWFRGFCLIDLLDDSGLARVAAAHADPAKRPLMEELRALAPGGDRHSPLWNAFASRQTEVCNNITDEILESGTQSPRHVEVRRSLETSAYMIAPLLAGGAPVGTLMIGLTGDQLFELDDVRPVEELAYRIALSVSNARAFAQAREANRLKDEFLAIVSHELRTPLNAMRGWLSLLKSAKLSEPQSAHARDVIERNIIAQTQLVEDLLDISRIVSGRMRLSVKPVALEAVVSAALDSLRLAAEAKGLQLVADIEQPAGQVAGDADRLQQIVWNLLSNAIKFTPRGGRVTVSLRRLDSHVELVVSDTGQGIAPAFLPHVFERFRQGDATTTRPTGGLGLGLAIVRNLAELHGGTVTAASDGEGTGASFTLSLPELVVENAQGGMRNAHATRPAQAAAATFSSDSAL